MKLEGIVALITGAGSGSGASHKIIFAEQGAKIFASDTNGGAESQIAHLLRDPRRKPIAVKGDVSNQTSGKRLVQQTTRLFVDWIFTEIKLTSRYIPNWRVKL